MTSILICDSPARAQTSARHLGARLSDVAARYLKSTPLAQWQQAKLQLDEAGIIAHAKARGLRLVRTRVINSDAYEAYDQSGKLLRRGNISSMRHFAESYRG